MIFFSLIKIIICIFILYNLYPFFKKMVSINCNRTEEFYVLYFLIILTFLTLTHSFKELFSFKIDIIELIISFIIFVMTVNDLKNKFQSKNFLITEIILFISFVIFIEIILQIKNFNYLNLFINFLKFMFFSLSLFYTLKWLFLFIYKKITLHYNFYLLIAIILLCFLSSFLEFIYYFCIIYNISFTISEFKIFFNILPYIFYSISRVLFLFYMLKLVYYYKINNKGE